MKSSQSSEQIKTTVYWNRDLYEQMKSVAGWNHRSINAELLTAAEEHVERENRKRSK